MKRPAPLVLLLLLALPAHAEKSAAQRWSGFVEYERSVSLTSGYDSTWMHATAVGTPTSHTTNNITDSLSATFILTGEETAIPVDIRYLQTVSKEVTSSAVIECRTPAGRHRAALNGSLTEKGQISASTRLPRGSVSVGFNNSTGDYTISVGAGDFPAEGSATFSNSQSGGCGNPRPANKSQLPPSRTTAGGFSAKGKGRTRVEPGKPVVLTGSYRISDTESLTWSLSSEPDNPPVAIHGPYRALRGEEVTFDGTRSRGENLTYKWRFKAGSCSTDPTLREAVLEGPVVRATLLCNTEVTLEVSDGKRTNKRTREAKVQPREWRTEVERGPTEYFVKPTYFDSTFHSLKAFWGANRCMEHADEREGNHYLHPEESQWDGGLYTLREVKDGGPFDGMAYVDLVTNPIRVPRKAWLNADLLPSSWIARENAKTRERAADFATLGRQVPAHEAIHTDLLAESIRNRDYAKELEFLVGDNREQLDEAVRTKLRQAESALAEATLNEAEIKTRLKRDYPEFNRPGIILIPIGDINGDSFYAWKFPSFAEVGDE